MSALSVKKFNLHDLLSQHGEHFKIPYYQRKYAWEERHCAELLDDILEVCNAQDRTHFFSNVTFSPLDGPGSYYVVDGQQRLTTFSLFLGALRKELKLGDAPALDQKLRACLFNGELLKLSFEDQTDQRTYRHLLLGHFCDPESRSENMATNFHFFRKRVNQDREKLGDFLANGLLEKLLFVRVVLPDAMPPQRVFERMNSTRVPVEDFDLIKNYLLMHAGDSEEERIYDRMEKNLADWQWRLDIRTLVSMHALTPISETEVYRPFKAFYPAGAKTTWEFLDQVDAWRQSFNEVRKIFGNLELNLGDWRVREPGGYGALMMRLAVTFPTPEDEIRRNRLIVRAVEYLRNWIASKRLTTYATHRGEWDTDRAYRCLKAAGVNTEDRYRLEEAVEKEFGVIPVEEVNAAIRQWVEEKWYADGYHINAHKVGIGTMVKENPEAHANEVVERFHRVFEAKKRDLLPAP